MLRSANWIRVLATFVALAVGACDDADNASELASDAGRGDAASLDAASLDAQANGRDAKADAELGADAASIDGSSASFPTTGADASFASDGMRLGGPSEGTLDADLGASPDGASDASLGCLLDADFRYFFVGGFVAFDTTYTVTSSGSFQRVTRNLSSPDAGLDSCTATLPACGDSAVDSADLAAALRNAEVRAAFTSDPTTILGRDLRYLDGSVLIVERADGKRISIGDVCVSGEPGCSPIPAGVLALSDLLFQLSSQQAASGPCSRMRI